MSARDPLEVEADLFIAELKLRAYGVLGAGNILEGDFGTWSEWRDALIEFAIRAAERGEKEKGNGNH